MGRLNEWAVFFREFRQTFETTGSVAPSSRFLAKSIVRMARSAPRPARLLEAGPGTGAFTTALIRTLQPGDTLELVELNDRFVELIHRRLTDDPVWNARRDQVTVTHGSAEAIADRPPFDAIICGLPFNNFDPGLVERLFDVFMRRLTPMGSFSFFEYAGIRRLKSPFVGPAERRRLAEVAAVIGRYIDRHQTSSELTLLNFPPAVVHRLQPNGKA